MRRASRAGFTLLEVLLSTVIGVLLMGALYTAMSMQLRHTHDGRDMVERSMLIRSLFTRMGNDITSCLAPSLPAPSSSSSSGGAGAAGGASATGGAAGTATAGAGSPTTGGTTTTASGDAVTINLGVQGDNNVLTVYVSRVPREIDAAPDVQATACDLRRITYWLSSSEPTGLCRQEYKLVTSAMAAAELPPNVSDEASYLIAEEVKTVQFQYFDGSSWQDQWDSTQPGADGVTPMGPPQAVSILIGLEAKGQANPKNYRHVVVLPAANGSTLPTAAQTADTAAGAGN